MKCKQLEPLVIDLLQKYPVMREDDFKLVLGVYLATNPIVFNMSFIDVMKQHEKLGLPSFASITRSRRKICESRPDLKDKATVKIRAEEQENYKRYSRES